VYVTPNRRAIIAATRGDAVIGWPEVADSLVRHRASHLIVGVDAVLDPAVLSPGAQAALGWPSPQMLSSVRSSKP
jgi:hypothetical protein